MRRQSIQKAVRIALFAAIITISSMITVPFAVPFTLQILAISVALMTLGGAEGCVAVAVYVSLGLLGLPVFAGFGSGVGYLLGASGGFVIGFLLGSICYFLLEKVFKISDRKRIVYAFVSLFVIYTVGTLWFTFVYSSGKTFFAALLVCTAPYVIPDTVKIFVASIISKRLRSAVNIRG